MAQVLSSPNHPNRNLVDVSDIFYFFFCSGRGSPRRQERVGGVGLLFKIPGGGGVSRGGGGFQEGCLERIGEFGGNLEGGLNIFFGGRNVHQGNDGRRV